MTERPLVSIGMPVYNEERFIIDSIESIINQGYENIELIISDNGSNDGTELICRDYERQYSWVKYNRFNINAGPTQNFNYVIENAGGMYFMWASGHDLWAENYLEECIASLENNPKAVVAFGLCRWIGVEGEFLDKQTGVSDTRGLSLIDRFFTVFLGNMHPVLGVMRITRPNKIKMLNTAGQDMMLLCHLALMGDFILASNTSWCRRDFRDEHTYKEKVKRYKNKEYQLSRGFLSKLFPLARLPAEIIKQILSSKISHGEKLLILISLVTLFPVKYLSGKYQR
jgi:glycosyltransferase involved in cell wall biosynthesis